MKDDLDSYNRPEVRKHNDALIKLLQVSVMGSKDKNPCIQEFEDAGMSDEVMLIIDKSAETDDRYFCCLETVASLANNDGDLA
jgi:hypothetical protein